MRLLLALALVLAGCSSGQPAGAPREGEDLRFVSLNPCTDAMLVALADSEQVLALSHYSHREGAASLELEVARTFPVTGGTVEEVLALHPDVVLADRFIPVATRQALEKLGVRIETFDMANSVASSLAQVQRLGELVGHQDRSDRLSRQIENAVASSRLAPGEDTISAVLWQPGGIVPGEKTLVSALMRETGLASHSEARGMGQADYLPLEMLLTDPPDVLLVAGDARAQHHAALDAIPGMMRADFDPTMLYCGGPTIIRAAERLAEIREMAR